MGSTPWAIVIRHSGGQRYSIPILFRSQEGYVSTILVTVTGPPSAPIFSGVMERNGMTNWYQLCGLTTTQYTKVLQNAQATRSILTGKSFADYGSPDRRYCASGVGYYTVGVFCRRVLHPYQNSINSETQNPFWRPSCLSVSEDHQITSTFVVGPGLWVARHGMTANDLQSEIVNQQAAGRYIIHLQGGGTGSNTNYAALWST